MDEKVHKQYYRYQFSGQSSDSEPFRIMDRQPETRSHVTFVLYLLWLFTHSAESEATWMKSGAL